MVERLIRNDGYTRGSYMLKSFEDGKLVGFHAFPVDFGAVNWTAPDDVQDAQWKAACKEAQAKRAEFAKRFLKTGNLELQAWRTRDA